MAQQQTIVMTKAQAHKFYLALNDARIANVNQWAKAKRARSCTQAWRADRMKFLSDRNKELQELQTIIGVAFSIFGH